MSGIAGRALCDYVVDNVVLNSGPFGCWTSNRGVIGEDFGEWC